MMKKTILAVSLSVLSVLGFSAVAQNQKVEGKKCEKQEVCNKQCKKEGKKECKKDGKEVRNFGQAQYNPFEGLNLSEAQLQKLAALKQDRPQGQRPENVKREQMTPEQRQARMQERDKRSREYLAKVKSILTPEQYVAFLENVAVHKTGRPNGQMMRNGGNGNHQGHKGPSGEHRS